MANPCTSDDVRVILAGIRRTLSTAPRRKAAATADRIRASPRIAEAFGVREVRLWW